MDSPNGNRVAATSSPSSGKSPAVQESPFSNFLSNLSPINSLKPVRYTQRLLETNLPIPPPVFTSPRIDLQRETSFLERDNIVAADSNFHEQCNTQLNAVQISNLEKKVQSCRSSGCVGDYLANPVEVDGINSANPCLQSTKEVCQLLQSGYTGSKDTIKKIDDAVDSTREAGGFTSLDQAENKLPLSSLKVVESAVNLRNDERFDEFLKFTPEKNNAIVVSDMSLDPVSGVQHCERYAAQNVGAKLDDRSGTCQSFPEPLQINEACENSDESSRRLSKENLKEASYHQHGTRRHLHFEADIACKNVATGNTANSRDSLTNLKNVVLSHGERRTISSSWESVSYGQSITSQSSFCPFEVVRSTQTSGNSAILSALPSGIGLHVNSIGRSVCLDSDMFASKNSTGYLSSQDKLVPERSNVVTKDPNSISISAVARTMFSHADVDQQESQAGVGATSAINSLNPSCDSFSSTQIEQQVASGEGRMSTSQNADSVEELKQVSPTRRRKRTANKSESDGCKLCNCKRSKCLKLYCECFATGVYCVDSCACENCLNKPEYDDLVLDTRQQIESRNPLAFTPKIITHATDSLENVMEEGNWNTPSSARHKRGCNCKKSKCLKRYCECYQAKVGCSDGCRCEGCQNSFGKKADLTQDRTPTWEGLTELNSSLHDIMEDDDIPAILKDTTFTALRAVKASSPNQKQVFPPRFQSERQRSSSPPGLRCGRKLSLQVVPSFPSLTPYSNSKEGDSLFRNDQTDSIDNH